MESGFSSLVAFPRRSEALAVHGGEEKEQFLRRANSVTLSHTIYWQIGALELLRGGNCL